jgi:DNA-binding transcriptional MerR regulator
MSERIYFSMRETIDATGVEAPTLRYWEKQFAELSPRKDRHGNRYYTAEDIALIKRIRFIRDVMKITRIEAIRNELQSGERQTDVRSEAVERLTRIRSKLQDLEKLLCLALIICLPLLSSCRGKDVLSSRQMVAVLTDMHRMDGMIIVTALSRDKGEEEMAYYDAVLAEHGVTRAQFDSSLVWYTQHPQRFNKIYPRVLQRLEAEHALFVDESEQIKALLATRKQHFELFTFERVIGSLQHGYPLDDYSLPPVDTIQVTIPLRDESTD